MAYRINLTNESQRITAATIDSSCTPRDRSLNKYTGVTTNNAWQDIVNGDSTPGDTALVLVINANTGSSSREGYGTIMYNIDGTECSKILHLVQAGSTPTGDIFYTNITNNTSSHLTFKTYEIVYSNGSTNSYDYGSGYEITAGGSVNDIEGRFGSSDEITTVRVIYTLDGVQKTRDLSTDEWYTTNAPRRELNENDHMYITIKS